MFYGVLVLMFPMVGLYVRCQHAATSLSSESTPRVPEGGRCGGWKTCNLLLHKVGQYTLNTVHLFVLFHCTHTTHTYAAGVHTPRLAQITIHFCLGIKNIHDRATLCSLRTPPSHPDPAHAPPPTLLSAGASLAALFRFPVEVNHVIPERIVWSLRHLLRHRRHHLFKQIVHPIARLRRHLEGRLKEERLRRWCASVDEKDD